MQSWRRELVGTLTEIESAALWVEEVGSALALPFDKFHALRVCAEELLTNIFRHSGAASPKIHMTLARFPDRIELAVEDDGKPFDVSRAIPRRVDHPLEKAQPGGLGVQLIHSFADHLRYRRAGLGNQVVAEFRLGSASETATRDLRSPA